MLRACTTSLVFLLVLPLTLSARSTCLQFDGIDDRVTVPNAPINAIGAGDFTLEAWVRNSVPEADMAMHPCILSNRTGPNTGPMLFFHDLYGGSRYKMLALRLGTVNYILIDNGTLNGPVLDGACHHVAVTRSGDTLHFFVDGVEIGQRAIIPPGGIMTNNTPAMWIGRDPVNGSVFEGTISEVRIWGRARTNAEIISAMNVIIPDHTPGLLGHWALQEGFGQYIGQGAWSGLLGTDAKEDTADPTWTGTCCVSGPSACLQFDGDDDRVTVPNAPINAIGAGDFTLEAWVRNSVPEVDMDPHPCILSNRTGSNTGPMLFFHDLWGGSQYKMLALRLGSVNYLFVNNGTLNGPVLDGTCHHVAVTRSGDTLHFFVDGVEIGQRAIIAPGGSMTNNTSAMWIGRDPVNYSAFQGSISEVRIWGRARSTAEIASAMGVVIPDQAPGLLGHWGLKEGFGQYIGADTWSGLLGTDANEDTTDPTWTATCCGPDAKDGVRVTPIALLQGAYTGGGLMSDALRSNGLLPSSEPYRSLGHTYAGAQYGSDAYPSALLTTGDHAIVDWVIVELRNAVDPTQIICSRPALLDRSGYVCELDGSIGITCPAAPGNYHLAIRHRNHLGVMTGAPVALGQAEQDVHLDLASSAVYGTNAQATVGDRMCLWMGDTTGDGVVKYTGAANDRDPILVAIGGTVPTNTWSPVYDVRDVNLDGIVKYTGTDNDRDPILVNIGGSVPTNTLLQQLP